MYRVIRPKTAVAVCVYGFTNTQFTKKEFVMVNDNNLIVSQLMEKALQSVEQYSEMEVIITKGNEHIVIDHDNKFIWNYKKG